MIDRPSFAPRLLAALLVAVALTALTPATFAQETKPLPPKPRESEKLEQGRGKVFGKGAVGGLTPVEAQAAQQLLDEGAALEASGKGSSALDVYKRLYKRYPRSLAAPEAYYRTAKIRLAEGHVEKAFEAYDAIVRAYPDYGHFNELISEEYRIAYDLVKGNVKRKMLGLVNVGAPRERGLAFFERVVFNAPFSDWAPLSLMNIAQTYVDMDSFDAAIFTLDRLITNYPNSLVTPDAYLLMAQVQERRVDGPHYDMASTQESINHYEDFIILFAKDPNVGEAEAGLARMKEMKAQSRIVMGDFYYYKRSRYQAAKAFYNEAITIAPTSEAAQSAKEKLAQLEVDEARFQARLAELAGKPPRKSFFGLFRKAPTIQPMVLPDDPSVKAEAEAPVAPGTVAPGTVTPGTAKPATP